MASRLITESDVRAGRISDPLVVDRDTIVTPSALDLLFARGVCVIFARGDATPPSCDSVGESTAPSASIPIANAALPAAPTCGCAKAGEKKDEPTSPVVDTSRRGMGPERRADWVEIYRRGKTRRFDPTPFRSRIAVGAGTDPDPGEGVEVVVTAIGSSTAAAFVEGIERLGHRIVAFSRRDGPGGAHLVARVRLGAPDDSIEAAIRSLESCPVGFEARVHRLL